TPVVAKQAEARGGEDGIRPAARRAKLASQIIFGPDPRSPRPFRTLQARSGGAPGWSCARVEKSRFRVDADRDDASKVERARIFLADDAPVPHRREPLADQGWDARIDERLVSL